MHETCLECGRDWVCLRIFTIIIITYCLTMIRVRYIATSPEHAIRSRLLDTPIWSARNPPEAIPAGLVPIHITTIPRIALRACFGLTAIMMVVCKIANPESPNPAAKKIKQLTHKLFDTANNAIEIRNNSELKKKVDW